MSFLPFVSRCHLPESPALVHQFHGVLAERIACAQTHAQSSSQPAANFVDIAEKSGLTMRNVFGGVDTKKYIIETTGTGVAIFDYDNDGWPDIFFVNGTTLEDMKAGKSGPTNHLYHNNHDGTFTDVTEKAGLLDATGWGQGVCVGDYDNDGWQDLYVTYYGENRLYRNDHGVFKLVSEKAGVEGNGKEWGAGCAFVDYDRDGHLDLFVANYVDFDVTTAPAPGDRPSCMWKGAPVMCGPRGLPHHKNILYHNRGDGTFEDVRQRRTSIERTATMAWGFRRSITTTMVGPTFMWPATVRRASCTTTITMGLLPTSPSLRVRRSMRTVASRAGWERPSATMTAMAVSTSSRRTSPTTLQRCITTMATERLQDVTTPAGLGLYTKYLGWGTMFFDFDNDSWPDLMLVNGHVYPEVDKFHLGSNYQEPRILYRNNGDGTFSDVSEKAGAGRYCHDVIAGAGSWRLVEHRARCRR